MNRTLSIIIPTYNEEKTIQEILNKIKNVKLNYEIEKSIYIVDDCSTDNTKTIVKNFVKNNPSLSIHYLFHNENRGKGSAIHTGISKAAGDFIIIQDADLEYDPEEYNQLLQPIITNHADVVYGSRFVGNNPHRILFFWHSIGNKFLTFLSNALTNLNLTDMETCYKMFRAEIIKEINLKEKRFGFEPEVTAKLSKMSNIRIYEIGISYHGRTYNEGKKMNWKDGFRAIWCILKYNLFK